MSATFGNGFEGLEDRTLLAAAVTTAFFNPVTGVLLLNGDGGSNEISIYNDGDGVQGHVTVNVNGETLKIGASTVSGGTYEFVGVTNIIVNSGGGIDNIQINDVNLSGGVVVNAGAGNDIVRVYDNGIRNEDISALDVSSSGTTLGGALILNGGTGNDFITVESNNFSQPPAESSFGASALPSSSLTVGSLLISGGLGNDDIDVDGVHVLGNAAILGDAGNDRFCVEDTSVNGFLVLNGGIGSDKAHLSGITAQGGMAVGFIESFLNYCPFNIG